MPTTNLLTHPPGVCEACFSTCVFCCSGCSVALLTCVNMCLTSAGRWQSSVRNTFHRKILATTAAAQVTPVSLQDITAGRWHTSVRDTIAGRWHMPVRDTAVAGDARQYETPAPVTHVSTRPARDTCQYDTAAERWKTSVQDTAAGHWHTSVRDTYHHRWHTSVRDIIFIINHPISSFVQSYIPWLCL